MNGSEMECCMELKMEVDGKMGIDVFVHSFSETFLYTYRFWQTHITNGVFQIYA